MAIPGADVVLIIRFSAPIPDLPLPLSDPQTISTASLSALVRTNLPYNLATCPLRYIYSGAILQADVPLSASLRLRSNTPLGQKFYVHCSVATDSFLTSDELDAETKSAAEFGEHHSNATIEAKRRSGERDVLTSLSQNPPEALGFDRLLSAGFTSSEVATLRSQFLALHAHAHIPDTMPSTAQLRALEDAWLDDNHTNGGGAISDGNGPGADLGDGSLASGSGALEDLLWGNVMGFFWALGAIFWLIREEGVWSRRRQMGVLTGVLVNIAFCVLKAGG